jgi:leucyl/phenylalanyl-tRNA--protein transferase
MVITPKSFHLSKSFAKLIRSHPYTIKVDADFSSVINQCQHIKRQGQTGTWINNNMRNAYQQLHQQGIAKSIEVYEKSQLIGGLYGIALGRVFFGESMFSIKNNTSKLALAYLLQQLPYDLVDCQIENSHLKRLGAFNLSRNLFINQLQKML